LSIVQIFAWRNGAGGGCVDKSLKEVCLRRACALREFEVLRRLGSLAKESRFLTGLSARFGMTTIIRKRFSSAAEAGFI
jgi:hypothetical protein